MERTDSKQCEFPGRAARSLTVGTVVLSGLVGVWLPSPVWAQPAATRPATTRPAATQPQPAARAASPDTASPEDGQPIRDVEITGNQLVTQAYIRSVIQTAPGQAYAKDVVQQDYRRLLRTGKFLTVSASARVEQGEVVVTFAVAERREVVSIDFKGNEKYDAKSLTKELDYAIGDPLDTFAVEQGRESILRKYREAGYGDAEVVFDKKLLDDGQVIYHVVEGPRIRVRKILFEGNVTFADSDLRAKIGTQTYLWIFRTGAYDVDQVRQDEAAIEKYYRDEGFLDVRISSRLEFSDDRRDLTITFTIFEGIRYQVKNINVRGNQVFTNEEIINQMILLPGDYWQQQRVDMDVKAITTLYGENGYVYTEVTAERLFLADEEGYINLNLNIREGEQVTVGRIVIRGNTQTKDKVARRELEFFPEELYNVTKLRRSEANLRESMLFSEAKITPLGQDPGVRDALVDLVENDQTTRLLFGGGIGSNSGLVGQFVIENRNFDIADWPRNWSEFFRGRSFRGAGQTLRLQVEPGTEFTRLTLDFREPYLLDKPISFGSRFYLFQRGRDAYDERRIGGNVSLGKRFKEGFLEGWAAEVALRLEAIDVSGVEFYTAKDIREDEGASALTSVKGSLVRNRTDSRFLPSKGDKLSFSYEQAGALGGDHFFGKALASYDWYKTMRIDVFERKSILGLHGSAGYILGDAPVFERFYAGGIGSVRGFEFRGISPRDGIQNDRVGGETLLLANAEYSFPLYEKVLRGVFFTDIGSVGEDSGLDTIRAAIGFGLRMNIQFFGSVPLEFDFAFPVSKDSDDDTQIFSFFFGTTF